MPEQYVATDKRTGVEVAITGEFPPHPDDRMRIARTATLFTRLVSTLLGKEESERRTGFRAVETQLELADALIRQDLDEVRRLVWQTFESMGVTQDHLEELARQLRDVSGLDEATIRELERALGLPPQPPGSPPPPENRAEESDGDEGPAADERADDRPPAPA